MKKEQLRSQTEKKVFTFATAKAVAGPSHEFLTYKKDLLKHYTLLQLPKNLIDFQEL